MTLNDIIDMVGNGGYRPDKGRPWYFDEVALLCDLESIVDLQPAVPEPIASPDCICNLCREVRKVSDYRGEVLGCLNP